MKEFNLIEILIASVFSLVGGSVYILGKMAADQYKSNWGILYDAAAAFFAGALCYVACRYFNLDTWITGGLTGLSGHAGARAIAMMEGLVVRRIGGTMPEDKQ